MTDDNCRRALERLSQFLDHELAAADEDEVRQHLAACEPCMDEFDVVIVMKRTVKRCCAGAIAPEDLRARIQRSLGQA